MQQFRFIRVAKTIIILVLTGPLSAIESKHGERSEQISTQPFTGRKVPEYENEDIHELIKKPYRIIYRLKQDQIEF
jgi:hypothetical protein